MRNGYRALSAIRENGTPPSPDYIAYAWQQKEELCAELNIEPELWVIIDYMIHLTHSMLRKKKPLAEKSIQQALRPLFEQHYRQIQNLYRDIPQQEYAYIQKDMKTFHHIVSHTINLIDKHYAHFIPSYLFVLSIDNMTVLSPVLERSIHPPLLAAGDFRLLLTRHLAGSFSVVLRNIIDFLLWYRVASPILIPTDIEYLKKQFADEVRAAAGSKFDHGSGTEYSMFQLISELREVITASLISEKLLEIMNRLNYIETRTLLPADEFLETLCDIFLPGTTTVDSSFIAARDVALAHELLGDMKNAVKKNDDDALFRAVHTASAVTPFIRHISMYLCDRKTSLFLGQFLELSNFLNRSLPRSITRPAINSMIDIIHPPLEAARHTFRSAGHEPSRENIELFAEKAIQTAAQE